MNRGGRWPAAVALALCAAGPAAGQRLGLTVGLEGGSARVVSLAPTGATARYRGTVFGGAGRLSYGRVALEVAYRQGTLSPKRDVVEATVHAAVRPTDWLAIRVGPHARAYVTPAGTERWVLWAFRVRGEQELAGPAVRVHGELWRALSGSVNSPAAFDRGQGGEVGLTVRGARFWGRLAYAIDDARLGAGARRETFDVLTIAVGVGK